MSIQANINQILSLAGMLTAMNPSVRAAAEKKAQIKNEKTAKAAVGTMGASKLLSSINRPEEMANRAQEAVKVAQEEKRRGRPKRDFLKSIGGEMTNLGVPVSVLAKTPEQKAAIRGAYTKQEKTQIMNAMEEKKSGK